MNGRIEAAQEKLEIAAYNWQKARNASGFNVDVFKNCCDYLDEAVTKLRREMDEYLKEKGSIPR